MIFVSDNGAPFINSKTTLYDAGVRLPLLVRQPGKPGGVINPNMVSFLDILPTCIDWATSVSGNTVQTENSSKSPPRRGVSFLRVVDQSEALPATVWKQHVFGSHTFHEIQNYWPTRYLRNRRYKYHRNIAWRLDFPFATDLYVSLSWEGIRNACSSKKINGDTKGDASNGTNGSDTPEIMIGRRRLQNYLYRGPEELFDLENDPEEVVNLINDTNLRSVVEEMRAELEKEQYETGDVWLFRDGVSVATTQGARKEGLRLPDRFDFDPRAPGNRSGPHWSPPTGAKVSGGGMVEYG